VVARNGASRGRERSVVVDADHVLVADLRARSHTAIRRELGEAAVDLPAAIGGADARVGLGWGLAARLLRLAQRSWYADGSAGLVDALMPLQRQLGCAGRGG
jgi:hypothetical protein